MSNTLKDAFKPTSKKSSSGKGPAYYNNEKKLLLLELAQSDVPAVRAELAKNTHTPTTILSVMIGVEEDVNILREVLMNPNVSRKAVATFVGDANDPRVEMFNDDDELVAHFTK